MNELLIVFTSDWSLISSVNKPGGTSIIRWITYHLNKCGCFSQMGDVLSASLRVSKLQKLEKGSILPIHNRDNLIMEVAPPPHKGSDLYALHSEWKVTEGVAEPNSIMGYKQAKWRTFVVEESFVPDFIRFCHL